MKAKIISCQFVREEYANIFISDLETVFELKKFSTSLMTLKVSNILELQF